LLNGQKTWTTSAHFAEWYWCGVRTDPDNKHMGITLMLIPMDHPGITINGIWTMGDERTNEVWLDDVFVPDEYVVGEVNHGFRYISQALDLERFTMFTYAPIKQRLDVLTEYVRTTERDGEPLKDDPVVRARMANLHTDAEVARVMGLKFVAEAVKVEERRAAARFQPPTVRLGVQAVRDRAVHAGWPTRRWTSGPGLPAAGPHPDAPMEGRSESTYRYTVIDTIGGGASEIQKNIIARRALGLPKNF
jgi:3-oxocholest-4-en-26-oyl-CoA dehydrogenase alpha subunit